MHSKIFMLYAMAIVAINIVLLVFADQESLFFHTHNDSSAILQKFDNVLGTSTEVEKEDVVGREIIPGYYVNP